MSQPTTTSSSNFASPLRSRLWHYLHSSSETCPFCDQATSPEKRDEISAKFTAKEHEQAQAVTAKLTASHDDALREANAKAQAELEIEREQNALRETAACDEVRKVSQAALEEKLGEAERVRLEGQAAFLETIAVAQTERLAAEQASLTIQAELKQQLQLAEAAIAETVAQGLIREVEVRDEAVAGAQADVTERLAAAAHERNHLEATLSAEVAATRLASEQLSASLQAQLVELEQSKQIEIARVVEDALANATVIRQEAIVTAEADLHAKFAEKDAALIDAQAQLAALGLKLEETSKLQELQLVAESRDLQNFRSGSSAACESVSNNAGELVAARLRPLRRVVTLSEELDGAFEAIEGITWLDVQRANGDPETLRRVGDVEALLGWLRKALGD